MFANFIGIKCGLGKNLREVGVEPAQKMRFPAHLPEVAHYVKINCKYSALFSSCKTHKNSIKR